MIDYSLYLKAAVLGVVEGLTEFLPVSSTGHLVLFSKIMGIEDNDFSNMFDVVVQFGSICALIYYFKHDLIQRVKNLFHADKSKKLFWCLVFAFLPAAVAGLLFSKQISFLLGSVMLVGVAQIVGAFFIFFAEYVAKKYKNKTQELDSVSYKQAVGVGLFQVLSLWPGMSRSGSTIMGGLLCKLDRPTATMFSFYLSIPVMTAATLYMLSKHFRTLNSLQNVGVLLVGFVFSFIVGLYVIKFMLKFVRTHSFVPFAYYRLALGVLILISVNQKWL